MIEEKLCLHEKVAVCKLLQPTLWTFSLQFATCCWMVAYVWRWIQQWRTDLHNFHGPEQLLVLALLMYCGEELLYWMLFLKKKKFTGLYINKIDCAPYLLYFHLSRHVKDKRWLLYFIAFIKEITLNIVFCTCKNRKKWCYFAPSCRLDQTNSLFSSLGPYVRVMTNAMDRWMAWGDTDMIWQWVPINAW